MNSDEAITHERKADISFEQCSRETLIDLLNQYARLHIALDAYWYLSIKREFGNAKALEYDLQIWKKMANREVESLTKALKIKERDVRSFFKVFLMTPGARLKRYKIDMKTDHHGVITFNHCPTLLALEREGEGRDQIHCKVVAAEFYMKFVKHFSPELEMLPLKIPPRKRRDEICCQWEVKKRSA